MTEHLTDKIRGRLRALATWLRGAAPAPHPPALATTSDNILDRETGKVRLAIQNRARVYHCAILTRDQVRELARSEAPTVLLEQVMGF